MNYRETSVFRRLRKDGWNVLRNGWPDFLCRRGSEIMAVEVKAMRNGLQPHQKRNHRILRKAGIKTIVIVESPPSGMRMTEEDARIVAALMAKLHCSFSEVVSRSLRALATKEGVTA